MKSNLFRIEEAETIRKLLTIEAKGSSIYFPYYFDYLGKSQIREKRGAKDPVNNLLNLGYEFLKAEIVKGIYRYHLDPYFGYLHSHANSKPSLACDLMEPYRIFVDIFVSRFVKKDIKFEYNSGSNFLNRKAKLEFINEFNKFLDQKTRVDKKYKNNNRV